MSDKERIKKEAREYCEGSPHYLFEHRAYITGANAQLERMAGLREALKELIPVAQRGYDLLVPFDKRNMGKDWLTKIERSKKLLDEQP